MLEGPAGGGRVAERVTGDRLQQESLRHPAAGQRHGDGAVEDGRERVRRGLRVASGEPKRREDDTHHPGFALLPVQPGEDGVHLPGFPQPQTGVQLARCHPCRHHVPRHDQLGQPLGSPVGGERVGGTAARELERSARGVQQPAASCPAGAPRGAAGRSRAPGRWRRARYGRHGPAGSASPGPRRRDSWHTSRCGEAGAPPLFRDQ